MWSPVERGDMGPPGPQMDQDAIDDFLARRGTGVLALAIGDTPYAVPVSYGFEADAGTFYLRLACRPGGRNEAFLDGATAARLVVYDRVNGEWYSVVAAGRLEAVRGDDVTPQVAEALRRADPPLVDLVDADDDVEFGIFRLRVDELTGRTTATA